MRKLALIAIAAISLSGCMTTVFLERTVPPDIVPAYSPTTVAFVNKFDYLTNPNIKEKHNIAYKTGIEAFVSTLTGYSAEDLVFRQNNKDTLWRAGALSLDPEGMVMSDTVMALTKARGTNHLLVLDTMEVWLDWETFREEDMEGSVSKRKDFYLGTRHFLSLYDSAGFLVMRTVLDKSMLYKSRPTLSGLITIVPNLANAKDEIEVLARDAGSQYISMFYDQTVREPRTLNAGKKFAASNALIMQRDYDRAIEQLEQIANHPKKKWRQRAEQNLSVARELKEFSR